MKKTLLILLTGTMLFSTNTLGIYAAPLCLNQYVDENGDGICDHAASDRECQFIDEDGDGICDHTKSRTRSGKKSQGIRNRSCRR